MLPKTIAESDQGSAGAVHPPPAGIHRAEHLAGGQAGNASAGVGLDLVPGNASGRPGGRRSRRLIAEDDGPIDPAKTRVGAEPRPGDVVPAFP